MIAMLELALANPKCGGRVYLGNGQLQLLAVLLPSTKRGEWHASDLNILLLSPIYETPEVADVFSVRVCHNVRLKSELMTSIDDRSDM